MLGDVTRLSNIANAAQLGLPPIMQSVVMDCRNKDDVELLVNDVYDIVLNMKQPHSRV